MIEFKNVSFSYDNKSILTNFSHQFKEGLYHIIIGPSGCGKSTLLKLIMHQLETDQGTIEMDKSQIRSFPDKTAMILQEGTLLSWFTVKKNLEIAYNLSQSDRDMNELIDNFSIRDLLYHYPHELSGGEYQRVEILRALLTNSKYLLLDEPLSSLDMISKDKIQRLLKTVQKEYGLSVIHITHDIEEAAYLGNEILIIGKGNYKGQSYEKDTEEFFQEMLTLRRLLEEVLI